MDYVEKFKYDGYCVIPNVISESERDRYVDLVKNVIQNNILVKDYKGNNNRLYNLSQIESQFLPLYNNPKLVDIAKSILDVESIDVWRDRLFSCETVLHPPLSMNSIIKCSPNKSLTCYLCLIDSKCVRISKGTHNFKNRDTYFQCHHQNSIEGEGTILNLSLRQAKIEPQDVEYSEMCAIFFHNNTIIEGSNPIDMSGTFYPVVAWEYIDTNQKNVYAKDNIEHERFTL